MSKPAISLDHLAQIVSRTQLLGRNREWSVAIRKFNPGGLTAHQLVDAVAVYGGSDWEAGRLILEPARPLTELTPEQVTAIEASVREGSSWHASQRDLKSRARIRALEDEIAALKAERTLAQHFQPAVDQESRSFLVSAGLQYAMGFAQALLPLVPQGVQLTVSAFSNPKDSGLFFHDEINRVAAKVLSHPVGEGGILYLGRSEDFEFPSRLAKDYLQYTCFAYEQIPGVAAHASEHFRLASEN